MSESLKRNVMHAAIFNMILRTDPYMSRGASTSSSTSLVPVPDRKKDPGIPPEDRKKGPGTPSTSTSTNTMY